MGGAITLVLPRWQIDPRREPLNRFSNTTTLGALKHKLLDDSYTSSLLESGEANYAMKEAICSIIGSKEIASQTDADLDTLEENTDSIPRRRAALEMIVGALTRLRNQNIYNFFCVVLSIIALGCNVPVQFWSLLSGMRLLFSRVWTINLVHEIGDEVSRRKSSDWSEDVGFCVADNKSYLSRITYMHAPGIEGVSDEPPKINGQFLHTVNNIQVPLRIPAGTIKVSEGY